MVRMFRAEAEPPRGRRASCGRGPPVAAPTLSSRRPGGASEDRIRAKRSALTSAPPTPQKESARRAASRDCRASSASSGLRRARRSLRPCTSTRSRLRTRPALPASASRYSAEVAKDSGEVKPRASREKAGAPPGAPRLRAQDRREPNWGSRKTDRLAADGAPACSRGVSSTRIGPRRSPAAMSFRRVVRSAASDGLKRLAQSRPTSSGSGRPVSRSAAPRAKTITPWGSISKTRSAPAKARPRRRTVLGSSGREDARVKPPLPIPPPCSR